MSYKKGGKIIQLNEERMMPEQCESLIREIYELLKKNQYGQYLKDVLDGKYLDSLH